MGAGLIGEQIREAGHCLYGRSWRYPFQVEFGVSARKLQRMLKGDEEMGAEMRDRVAAALVDRVASISRLVRLTARVTDGVVVGKVDTATDRAAE